MLVYKEREHMLYNQVEESTSEIWVVIFTEEKIWEY